MIQKQKPPSKIPTTQTNTNRKRKDGNPPSMSGGPSLLKKNEFALIIIGALVVTVAASFLFFRSKPSKPVAPALGGLNSAGTATDFPKRLEAIEGTLELIQSRQNRFFKDDGPAVPEEKGGASLAKLEQQVARLETAVSLKIDSLNDRLGKMERKVAALEKSRARKAAAKPKPVVVPSAAVKKAAPKTAAAKKTTPKTGTVKAAAPDLKKTGIFHTVKKGETLWRISRQYNTTVAKIRQLNNMSPDAKIYPGSNILVR